MPWLIEIQDCRISMISKILHLDNLANPVILSKTDLRCTHALTIKAARNFLGVERVALHQKLDKSAD